MPTPVSSSSAPITTAPPETAPIAVKGAASVGAAVLGTLAGAAEGERLRHLYDCNKP